MQSNVNENIFKDLKQKTEVVQELKSIKNNNESENKNNNESENNKNYNENSKIKKLENKPIFMVGATPPAIIFIKPK